MDIESDLKAKARKKLIKAGWRVIQIKLTSEEGFPDTLNFNKEKKILAFIEYKRNGKVPSALQLFKIKELNNAGIIAFWVDNLNQITEFIKRN